MWRKIFISTCKQESAALVIFILLVETSSRAFIQALGALTTLIWCIRGLELFSIIVPGCGKALEKIIN
jgi:hypothetical protein